MPDARDVYREKPTQDEIDDVLEQRVSAAVGTINPDGSVHLAFVLFRRDGDRLYFETSSTTRKARNIAAHGAASMLVQGTAASGRHLMVAVRGKGTPDRRCRCARREPPAPSEVHPP
jgi:general stress protein 26